MNRQTRLFLFITALVLTGLACASITGSGESDDSAEPGILIGGPDNSSILFQDDFSSTRSGWDQETSENRVTDYAQDGYRIFVNNANFDYWANPGLNFTDSSTTVEATKIGGPDDNDFGILCRYTENSDDTFSFYMFIISSDGFFNISKADGGEQNNLYDPVEGYWGQSDAIKKGSGVMNVIRVDCIGSTLTLYVNGTQVASVTDSALTSGDVGLVAGTFDEVGVDILFDNLVVRKP